MTFDLIINHKWAWYSRRDSINRELPMKVIPIRFHSLCIIGHSCRIHCSLWLQVVVDGALLENWQNTQCPVESWRPFLNGEEGAYHLNIILPRLFTRERIRFIYESRRRCLPIFVVTMHQSIQYHIDVST